MENRNEPQTVAQVMQQQLSLPTATIQKPDYEHAADVPLTPQETHHALMAAKWEKMERLGKLQAEQNRQKQRANLTRPWTWQEMLHFVRFQAQDRLKMIFSVDSTNEHSIGALCRYFVGDPEFENMGEGWSLSKGLMLMGNVGTGKTTLAKLFCRNQRQCYRMTSARMVADLYEQDGEKAIENFSAPFYDVGNDPRYFYQRELTICFDDLGTEKIPVLRFGNKANTMAEVLLNRYDAGLLTHVTTNLLGEELEKAYGTRVRSRMTEMFNLITVDGKDRRMPANPSNTPQP